METNIMNFFIKNWVSIVNRMPSMGVSVMEDGSQRRGVIYPSVPGSPILYLYGYDNFIAHNSLIPLYNKDQKSPFRPKPRGFTTDFPTDGTGTLSGPWGKWSGGLLGGREHGGKPQLSPIRPTKGSDAIDQAYYYLTPFVHDNFIIEHKIKGPAASSSYRQAAGDVLPEYFGYNGLTPILTSVNVDGQPHHFVVNEGKSYGDKFLVFPPSHEYIEFKFVPHEDNNNIYEVPIIGKVRLEQPADDQPWYGKQIKIFFEPGYVAPEIKQEASLKFSVKLINVKGKVQVVDVSVPLSASVDAAKQQVELATGISTSQQRFVFAGRELKSDALLSDYHVPEGANVSLFVEVADADAEAKV
jgi:hypothetical protein